MYVRSYIRVVKSREVVQNKYGHTGWTAMDVIGWWLLQNSTEEEKWGRTYATVSS